MVTSITKARQQTRLSRSLGVPFTHKARKYYSKRSYAPGQHGVLRRKTSSDYAIRLKQKQIVRTQYMIKEKQLKSIYGVAKNLSGQTGESMLRILETRLDSLVLRAGFARTILQARQLVTHKHIYVDGKVINIPSYNVTVGQHICVKPSSHITIPFRVAATGIHQDVNGKPPEYLDVRIEKLTFTLTHLPKQEEIPTESNIQMVVEFYAR